MKSAMPLISVGLICGLITSSVRSVAAVPTSQTIYDGALENGWVYYGWGNSNLTNSTPALSADSIQVQLGAWQGLYVHHTAFQTSPQMFATLWVNGGATGGQPLMLVAMRNGVGQTSFPLGAIKPNTWQQFQIPLTSLGAGSVPDMDGIVLQNNSGNTLTPFYVDQLSIGPAASLSIPTNLNVLGLWNGGPTDALGWSPVPGAASYTVYRYGLPIATGLKTSSYTLPQSAFYDGMTYAVTSVDSMGMESLPSAIAGARGKPNPSHSPAWGPSAPVVPTRPRAVAEWNNGMPRVHLAWNGDGTNYTYNVYRDGVLTATGLWGLNYFDTAVSPGETHTYTITGVNVPWTAAVESAQSASVSATALSVVPVPQNAPIQITATQANDDSVVVSFAAVSGAVDYRMYDKANPNTVKYSGGSLSIEMNGLDPAATTNLVVEAVDKLGPFQTMDGMAGPGAMQMDGMHSAINGQGDPSDIPNILAASAPSHVTCQPAALTGSQAFFDTFRGEKPLTAQPLPALIPGTFYGDSANYASFANDKWTIRDYGGDLKDTQVFFMGSHFMDTLYDGGTPGTNNPIHNNNASLVMMPNATADISGGKVLHVTFEVDAHMDGRRWCDVFVGAAGDTLIDPGKFADFAGRKPTLSGKLFRWEVQKDAHLLNIFPGVQPDAQSDIVHLTDQANGIGLDSFGICARSSSQGLIPFNGTPGDLDKRHKFDLYLSQNRVVIMEQGKVVKDAAFPDGVTLPFDKCQVYFIHQLYHTGNDRPELLDYDPADCYWVNNRPYSDERHWDNMGEEVLTAFPTLP